MIRLGKYYLKIWQALEKQTIPFKRFPADSIISIFRHMGLDGQMAAHSIVLKGRCIEFSLRRSPFSQCIRFSLNRSGELSVSGPLWMRTDQVRQAIRDKQDWVLEKIKKTSRPPLRSARFLGKTYSIRKTVSSGKRPKVMLKNEILYVMVPDDSERSLMAVLERWYIKEARNLFHKLVKKHSKQPINRIAIRNQKTRWGSCSNGRNLNFNWRLLMAPLEIVEYIVVHELAHLEEMNHSKSFWRIVASRCPEYKQHNKWLRVNGPGLIL